MNDSFIFGCSVLAAAMAVFYWLRWSAMEDPGPVGAAVKAASTAFIALALWRLAGRHGQVELWPVVIGMVLGAAGDWLLARPGQRSFLAGMAAFGLGHLAYAGGLLWQTARMGFDDLSSGRVIAGLGIVALCLSTELWLAPRTGALRWPVRIYVVLIGLMGLTLCLLPERLATPLLRMGGGLFILSDLLLALRLFVATGRRARVALSLVLWPAYWCGQALIALGASIFRPF